MTNQQGPTHEGSQPSESAADVPSESTDETHRDAKDIMREALDRKKQASHHDNDGLAGGSRLPGGAHRQAGGRRQFRRKSGS